MLEMFMAQRGKMLSVAQEFGLAPAAGVGARASCSPASR